MRASHSETGLPAASALGGPPLLVAAIVLISTIAGFSLGTEPAIASQLGAQLHLTSHSTALLLSVEGGASMLATVPAVVWIRYLPLRTVAQGGALLFIAANLLSSRYEAFDALLLWRALAGFAGGTLLIVCLMSAARCANPDRVYGGWVIGQTVASTAGLYCLQRLFSSHGLGVAYALMAVSMLLVFPFVVAFRAGLEPAVHADPSPPRSGRIAAASAALGLLFLFYMSLGGIWAFEGNRGAAAGVSPHDIAADLATANLLSLLGAAFAAWIGKSAWRPQLILAGQGLLGLSFLLFAVGEGAWAFVASAVLLQLAWSFTAPFLLSLAAEVEPAGSMMIPTNFILGAGLAVGTLVTGFLLEVQGGFSLAAAASALLTGLGLLVLRTHSRSAAS